MLVIVAILQPSRVRKATHCTKYSTIGLRLLTCRWNQCPCSHDEVPWFWLSTGLFPKWRDFPIYQIRLCSNFVIIDLQAQITFFLSLMGYPSSPHPVRNVAPPFLHLDGGISANSSISTTPGLTPSLYTCNPEVQKYAQNTCRNCFAYSILKFNTIKWLPHSQDLSAFRIWP